MEIIYCRIPIAVKLFKFSPIGVQERAEAVFLL